MRTYACCSRMLSTGVRQRLPPIEGVLGDRLRAATSREPTRGESQGSNVPSLCQLRDVLVHCAYADLITEHSIEPSSNLREASRSSKSFSLSLECVDEACELAVSLIGPCLTESFSR